jgi:antitoxin MazE
VGLWQNIIRFIARYDLPSFIYILTIEPHPLLLTLYAELLQSKIGREKSVFIVCLQVITQRTPAVVFRLLNDAGAYRIQVYVSQAVDQRFAVFYNHTLEQTASEIVDWKNQNFPLDKKAACNYSDHILCHSKPGVNSMENHARVRDAKLVPIGNSKGIRIPKGLLQKYGLKDSLLIEETDRGLLLRNKEESKLSWKETYKAMADQRENWDDFDATLLDGLEDEDFGD